MKRHRPILFAVIFLSLLAGCVTARKDRDMMPSPDSHTLFPTDPPVLTAEPVARFEDEGRFIMIEGSQCVTQENGPDSAAMLISVEMPDYVNRGTAILNGWDLRYLESDHEVRQLRADITNSKLVTGGGPPITLVFAVEGELSDQNWDDAYEFCVHYTGIGFNSDAFDARVEGDYNGVDTWEYQTDKEGPVATLESIWADGTLQGSDSIAVLPRGFNFQYDNEFECGIRIPPCVWEDPADHHLLQAAYSLFQVGASPNPDGKPHWVTQTLFKDNSTRTHWITTRAALIGGDSVKLRADFLPLNPHPGEARNCSTSHKGGEVHTETVRLYELPYDYAVPMLTGWDLNYGCDDQHVQRAGIWIHDIRFDPDTNGLEYKVSSILRDKNGDPGFNAAHRITVLGLNRSSVPPVFEDVPANERATPE